MDAAQPLLHNNQGEGACAKAGQKCPTARATGQQKMKHPSSREFFAYWDKMRGTATAPDRSDVEPSAVRELLGDIFVLSYDNEAGFPFRVAGTRVSALLGRDLKDQSFSALFTPESPPRNRGNRHRRRRGNPARDCRRHRDRGDRRDSRISNCCCCPSSTRAHAPISLTGVLAPFESELGKLGEFRPHLLPLPAPPGKAAAARHSQAAGRPRLHGL